ncbi:ribonuclease HII [Truepera radiovictrix]|uniref:Ribonuclease HII n=1 Tax=Truepera radiovictrix (strain DSM 17093 / CIP 108686 / LMG 22925 / RQ-24) TaxID=649638 RepID=D7CUC8_TRURR|nr:ribonuclease HII [Truepera radiovictrix]ADI15713.1 Ribonuclease H [Truepera radiovictrix DSM 17093]WMT58661.1 ribonuclease HII [Truepera radiovictrix]
MTIPTPPDWRLEHTLWQRGYGVLAGVDEAGRGALAGPVVAAAVVLPRGDHPFRDSKTLSPAARETLAEEVRRRALAWAVGCASASEVDRLNVLQATHLAAQRALCALAGRVAVDGLVTDFLKLPFPGPVLAVPKADATSVQVAAASLLAKTVRDALMRRLGERYPAYGFARHKGYGSSTHLRALAAHGPCPEHRRSFGPVQRCLTPAAKRG